MNLVKFDGEKCVLAENIWKLLVICWKMHEFFEHCWRQPRCECSNVAHIPKNNWKYNVNHFDFVQRDPFQNGFDLFVVQCPINLNDRNGCVRKNRLIWIQIKNKTAQQRRQLIVPLGLFLIQINIATIQPTIYKLQFEMHSMKIVASLHSVLFCWKNERKKIKFLLDKFPHNPAKTSPNSSSIAWETHGIYSKDFAIFWDNYKWRFVPLPNWVHILNTF